MTPNRIFLAARKSAQSNLMEYSFARMFGVRAVIEFEERRIENHEVKVERRQAHIRTLNGVDYLIDDRIRTDEVNYAN